jgi:diguanylate cyclase (GGDEF)-like protein
MRGKMSLGVIAVGWPDAIRIDGPQATVVALLAHEAAAVIDRADAMTDLDDEARTDSLTGLPNRRAWDAGLQRAMSESKQLVIAILDLDHFKQYNDVNGHPAGDRLLKETASAWRDQLRTGDFLARIGGEEFGVLLDCSLNDAADVVERVRAQVVQGRTCSAGIAMRRVGESLDAVVARADHALYKAKSQGRDRTCLSTTGPVIQGLALLADEPARVLDDGTPPGREVTEIVRGAGRRVDPPDSAA